MDAAPTAAVDGVAAAAVANVYVGNANGSNGSLSLLNGGTMNSGGEIRIGNSGTGTLTVEDGAAASAGTLLYVGNNNGSNGTLTISSGGEVSSAQSCVHRCCRWQCGVRRR
ncbi:hypothetical protein [Mesorhizobium sp. J428]|uniref:hypothetical protein n=1 Tax=Mesorhizobium sp. J428 TaxID=2898440 RepID=UPI0035B4908A